MSWQTQKAYTTGRRTTQPRDDETPFNDLLVDRETETETERQRDRDRETARNREEGGAS